MRERERTVDVAPTLRYTSTRICAHAHTHTRALDTGARWEHAAHTCAHGPQQRTHFCICGDTCTNSHHSTSPSRELVEAPGSRTHRPPVRSSLPVALCAGSGVCKWITAVAPPARSNGVNLTPPDKLSRSDQRGQSVPTERRTQESCAKFKGSGWWWWWEMKVRLSPLEEQFACQITRARIGPAARPAEPEENENVLPVRDHPHFRGNY